MNRGIESHASGFPRRAAITACIDLATLLREIEIYLSFWDQVANDGPSVQNEQESR